VSQQWIVRLWQEAIGLRFESDEAD